MLQPREVSEKGAVPMMPAPVAAQHAIAAGLCRGNRHARRERFYRWNVRAQAFRRPRRSRRPREHAIVPTVREAAALADLGAVAREGVLPPDLRHLHARLADVGAAVVAHLHVEGRVSLGDAARLP